MTFAKMQTLALLTLALISPITARSWSLRSRDFNPASESTMVSSHLPPGFVDNYNHTYCPADTLPIYVPPVYVYYPVNSEEVYGLVGDFFNISWISPSIMVTHSGVDNQVGAIRYQTGDPFAEAEILASYNNVTTDKGFYYQSSNSGSGAKAWSPGFTTSALRPVLTLQPACNAKGSQLGFYLSYCMSVNSTATPAGFNSTAAAAGLSQAAATGSAAALNHLWTTLVPGNATAFNSTGSCKLINKYRHQLPGASYNM